MPLLVKIYEQFFLPEKYPVKIHLTAFETLNELLSPFTTIRCQSTGTYGAFDDALMHMHLARRRLSRRLPHKFFEELEPTRRFPIKTHPIKFESLRRSPVFDHDYLRSDHRVLHSPRSCSPPRRMHLVNSPHHASFRETIPRENAGRSPNISYQTHRYPHPCPSSQ